MTKRARRALLVFLFCIVALGVGGSFVKVGYSANLNNISVTVSNPRPSFRGALTTGNTEGSSIITINSTQGSYPSTSSAQLVEGDVLRIGESGSLGSYTVASTSSLSTISLTSVLAAGDTDAGDDVISSQSASHTVRLTTATAIANGRIRILVPALASDTASADGIPDSTYFDFGTTAPTVTCPDDITGYDFVAGTASASAITVDGTDYHAFECAYSGAGGISTAFDGTTNDYFLIDSLINPAPKSDHTVGTADTYPIIVQHLDSSFNVIDKSTVRIGVIEAVKVTAEVAPQISFRIIGNDAGTAACGFSGGTDVPTTAYNVPFGTLSISDFTTASQILTVSTNAANGYAVTAVENDQLGLDGATCTGDNTGANCIPDAVGDNSTMTHSSSDEWSSASVKGFAYSLHDSDTSGLTAAFEYDSSSGSCDGTGDCFRQFADAENSQSPVTIFSNTSVADNHHLYVCYKSIISATQAAGFYENYITYTATATF
ncbi:MAG: hypothetical protein ACOZAN_04430 [Patescibacteria group bacterium]